MVDAPFSMNAIYRAFTAIDDHGAMRPCLIATLAAAMASANAALGASLVVDVRGADGRPVADVVATLKALDAPAAPPARFAWPTIMAQHDIRFAPYILVVPVGAEVSFPNRDSVRHHVYSFSPAKSFQLKLYGRDESRTVVFDRAGVVPLGCNIHDQMIGFIDVVDTPWAAKTDASGEAVLQGVPAGRAQLTLWHPEMKSPRNQQTLTLSIPAVGGHESVNVVMGPPLRRSKAAG